LSGGGRPRKNKNHDQVLDGLSTGVEPEPEKCVQCGEQLPDLMSHQIQIVIVITRGPVNTVASPRFCSYAHLKAWVNNNDPRVD
jgi:hypothetical protein